MKLAFLTTPQGNDGMVGLIVADELCGSFAPDEYDRAEHIVKEINDAIARITSGAAEALTRIAALGKDFDCRTPDKCGSWHQCRVHQMQTLADECLPVPSSAESADIGKLDSADKSASCSSPTGNCVNHGACNAADKCTYKAAGSAETGGEKAAPAKNAAMEIWPRGAFESEEQFAARVQRISAIISRHYQPMVDELAGLRKRGIVGEVYGLDCEETSGCPGTGEPNFPRSSQNQTVSSGVEGAHEGTTADKSEPEKLNNAQNIGERFAGEMIDNLKASADTKVALAESSLSQKCDVCHLTLDDMGNCFNCSSELDSDQKRDAKKRCNICGDKKCICDEYGHQNPPNSESSLSSPPPISAREFRQKHYVLPSSLDTYLKAEDFAEAYANFRQSPSPMNRGAESVHSGKQNTADKSGLLPTQLPKEK
jgi:hypothetical protein